MFDKLSSRLAAVVEGLRGRGRLTEENVAETLRQVRMALLEADVALPVVKEFIDAVKARAVGLEIHKSLTPGQALVRVIHEELVRVMGEGVRPLNLRAQPPVVMLLAGLQGAGKTTTAAKIAKWLKERDRKRVLMVIAPTSTVRPRCCSWSAWASSSASTWRLPIRPRRRSRSRGARSTRRVAASTTCCWWTPPVACTWTRR